MLETPPFRESIDDPRAPIEGGGAGPAGAGVRGPRLFSRVWQNWIQALRDTVVATPAPGTIEMWLRADLPDERAFFLNGAVYKRAAQPGLFKLLGTTYNIGGEGADEFRVADFRDCFPFGAGTAYTLGQKFGTLNHKHTAAAHTHPVTGASGAGGTGAVTGTAASGGGGAITGAVANDGAAAVTGATGSDGPSAHVHSNSGDTGGPSATQAVAAGSEIDVAAANHVHGFDHDTGTENSSLAHTHPAGTLTGPSHSHGAGTLAAPAHAHDAGTLAGPSHTHAAGTLAAGSGGAVDTGSANPPGFATNFIIWAYPK